MGASGVGKTTLSRHVADRWGLEMLSGATARALSLAGCTFESMLTDLADADRFQEEVWRCQLALEEPHWRAGTGFVSDRSFDLLAYTARQSRSAWKVFRSPGYAAYMDRLRAGASVFFVRPHPLVTAATPRDGRRDRFLEPEWVHGVDGVVEFLLETNEIPYVVVQSCSLKDKFRTVEAFLGAPCR